MELQYTKTVNDSSVGAATFYRILAHILQDLGIKCKAVFSLPFPDLILTVSSSLPERERVGGGSKVITLY